MKSSKNLRQQYGNPDRKGDGSSKREKGSKLDRKSSRGMIYENEELRLRTININAEVERGQSDIKRLRRENEQLRREIWTLRDECDRLNKRFKAKLLEYDHGLCSARQSGYSGGGRGSVQCDSNCNSDDSDSCDTCKGNDDQCSDDCCTGGSCPQLSTNNASAECAPDMPTATAMRPGLANVGSNSSTAESEGAPNLQQTFDHLSVVSEETLSNSELQAQVPHNETPHVYTSESSSPKMTIPSLIGPMTPLTPVEQVANQLSDLQAVVPSLSYFENVLQQHMGSNIGHSPNASPPTSTTMRHTNGWDYKLQSPFAHRKYSADCVPSSTALSSNTAQQQPQYAPTQSLSTFVPTAVTAPSSVECTSTSENSTATVPSTIQTNTTAIETVAITTMPVNMSPAFSSPRHFFAPLKPRLKINTALATNIPASSTEILTPTTTAVELAKACHNCDPPDIYVHNGLASSYQRQATISAPNAMPSPSPVPQRASSSQTESVNLETILSDIQAISEDILAIQLDKKTTTDDGSDGSKPLEQNDKNKKPYRSEMNLTLKYDGANQAVTSANSTANATQTQPGKSNVGLSMRCTRSLERDNTDSPSPHIPDAMLPFPDKRTYIGFDQLNAEAAIANVANIQRPTLPHIGAVPMKLPTPPLPPARLLPSPLHTRCGGMARGTPVAIPQTPIGERQSTKPNTPLIADLAPNKSQLYTSVAHAAAKRAQFRSALSHLTQSVDVEEEPGMDSITAKETNNVDAANEALNSEAARRKARRVSIVCGDSSTPDSPDHVPNTQLMRSQAQSNLSDAQDVNSTSNSAIINASNPLTGSCSDLPSALANPALKNLQQSSHSTPNSPHSARRRSHSNILSPNNVGLGADPTHPQSLSAASSPRHTGSVHHHHTNSSCSNLAVAHQRKSSQDSTRGNSAEVVLIAEAFAGRSRCSRRHSDGTVASNVQRVSGISGHHHHHHHHHHQHSASVVANNLHQSHHSHQDSTSYSEHGSNSLTSSRESSTSFSVRSHRRKISISSHTGGKIPWCGCWGNGCL